MNDAVKTNFFARVCSALIVAASLVAFAPVAEAQLCGESWAESSLRAAAARLPLAATRYVPVASASGRGRHHQQQNHGNRHHGHSGHNRRQ